tara:strand:- start:1168 stop:4284 length:3117 start_codon:yes stop_codon:yes gene_type:complete
MLLFADLHCSIKTLDLCLDVLKDIHTRAIKMNTTVGFLGDFFDTVYRRGTIPVDMLNTLLDFFADEWKVEMIMIPGNHDYIDASETEHALEPFRYASNYIKIIDKPTVLNDILWMPWKRNNEEIKQVFRFVKNYKVIFGHFDVIGAIHSNILSDRGLKKDDFPTLTITGHYHRPQTIGNVTYIGSPYQTSMNEAEQRKRLLFLKNNVELVSIPVSYGPKRFKISEDPETWPTGLVKGDIVYMNSFSPENLSDEAFHWIKHIKTLGVDVIVQRFLKDKKADALLTSETEQTPEEMFKRYGKHFKLENEAGYSNLLSMIAKETVNDLKPIPSLLSFTDIKFEGFGPFVSEFTLNLSERGLTKVTGKWIEGSVGSSNGAGKSMATVSVFLWCLTGYSDMRASSSLKKSQASSASINHTKGMARATMNGFLGTKPWSVSRSSSLHDKTSFLEFVFDNKRITKSTQNMTQKEINKILFRIPETNNLPKASQKRLHAWLMRTMVWEQVGMNKLWLEGNDKSTKEDLLMLCNMNIWSKLNEKATQNLTFIESNYNSTKNLTNNARVIQTQAINRHKRLMKLKKEWIDKNNVKISKLRKDLTIYTTQMEQLGSEPVVGTKPENKLKRKHDDISKQFNIISHKKKSTESQASKYYKIHTEEGKSKFTSDVLEPVYDKKAPPSQILHNAIEEMAVRKQQMNLLLKAFNKPTVCPTCKQMIANHNKPTYKDIEQAKNNLLQSKEIIKYEKEKVRCHDEKIKIEHAKQIRIKAWKTMVETNAEYEKTKTLFDICQREKDHLLEIQTRWDAQNILHSQWVSRRNEILSCIRLIKRNVDTLCNESCPMLTEEENVLQVIKENDLTIEKYTHQLKELEKEIEEMKNIKLWTSTKGIQTYIVERILYKMSLITTDWCKRLFDEDSQGSPMFSMEIDEKEGISKILQFGEDKRAHALSGGQYRRLQIAAFMAWRTQSEIYTGIHTNLTILDEPAANIDVVGFRQMEKALKDWCGKSKTCIFISHDIDSDKDSSIYDTHIEIKASKGKSVLYDYEQ